MKLPTSKEEQCERCGTTSVRGRRARRTDSVGNAKGACPHTCNTYIHTTTPKTKKNLHPEEGNNNKSLSLRALHKHVIGHDECTYPITYKRNKAGTTRMDGMLGGNWKEGERGVAFLHLAIRNILLVGNVCTPYKEQRDQLRHKIESIILHSNFKKQSHQQHK